MKNKKYVNIKCDGKTYRINIAKIINLLMKLKSKYMTIKDEDDILILLVKYNLFEKEFLENFKKL